VGKGREDGKIHGSLGLSLLESRFVIVCFICKKRLKCERNMEAVSISSVSSPKLLTGFLSNAILRAQTEFIGQINFAPYISSTCIRIYVHTLI